MAKKRGKNPIIEGRQATFVWHGPSAPALVGDFNDWDPEQALELEKRGRDVWACSLGFAEDAYIEYAFLQGDERVTDPGNPQQVYNGVGGFNHYFYMPQGRPSSLAEAQPGVQPGRVSAHLVGARILLGEGPETWRMYDRMIYLYQPAVEEPCPLLVVYDGTDYLLRGRLATVVDNLIHQGRIHPVALAMAANGGELRGAEYICSDLTVGFVRDTVVPLAQERLNLLDWRDDPGAYGVLGASLGGLMAMYTALRLPHVFGRVLSHSGAFDPAFPLQRVMQDGPAKPVQVWLEVGEYESLLEPNRQMRDLLREKEYEAGYHEYPGGHNYTAWRDNLAHGLKALFPPVSPG